MPESTKGKPQNGAGLVNAKEELAIAKSERVYDSKTQSDEIILKMGPLMLGGQ